jgi:hypothetical protein
MESETLMLPLGATAVLPPVATFLRAMGTPPPVATVLRVMTSPLVAIVKCGE